jgi:hypothetical protein
VSAMRELMQRCTAHRAQAHHNHVVCVRHVLNDGRTSRSRQRIARRALTQ